MLMDRIIEHIERLLLRHDCVIIPDFGGFVLQSVPAVYMGDEHSFTPARKEIVFNPTLTYNDGLLTESYMQEYAMDFRNALQLLREDVSGMKEMLDDDAEFQFGRIGLFMKEDDRILFIPGKNSDLLFSTSSYGLPVFHYLSLASRKPVAGIANEPVAEDTVTGLKKAENPLPKSKNVIYTIPVTRTFVRVLAATAAAVVLFLLISTPVKDVNKASYSASFIPQEIMPKKMADEIVADAFSTSDALGYTENPVSDGYVTEPGMGGSTMLSANIKLKDVLKAADVDAKSVIEKTTPEVVSETTKIPEAMSGTSTNSPEIKPEVKTTNESKTTHTASKTSSKSSTNKTSSASSARTASKAVPGKYYVIIGSFNTHRQAQGYIKRLNGDVADSVGIIVNDGRVRVYAKQFSNEKSAQSYLNKIRQNSKHEEAWLYKGR